MGYHRAGFDVVGVDIKPQPHYPFEFYRLDAVEDFDWITNLRHFDAIHASPPCQAFTQMSARWRGKGTKADQHPDFLTPTLRGLRQMDIPWVVENVPGARSFMPDTITLHGGMFGLGVHRPRLFCSNVLLMVPKSAQTQHPIGVYGKPDGRTVYKGKSLIRAWKSLEEGSAAMGIDWMDVAELSQAIPPAYTEFIGQHLMSVVRPAPSHLEGTPSGG